jgi:hypothetical protein
VGGEPYFATLGLNSSAPAARIGRLVDLEAQQRRAEPFAMRVEGKRARDPAAESAVQHEIQGAELRQLVTDDLALDDTGKQRPHALHGHLIAEMPEMSRIVGNNRDVAGIAFVAGSRMRDVAQLHRSHSI